MILFNFVKVDLQVIENGRLYGNINVWYERYYEENGSIGKRVIIKLMFKVLVDVYNFKVIVIFGLQMLLVWGYRLF